MEFSKANHDLQIVIDPYSFLQYVSKYVTKGEAGMSELMAAINNNNIFQGL